MVVYMSSYTKTKKQKIELCELVNKYPYTQNNVPGDPGNPHH